MTRARFWIVFRIAFSVLIGFFLVVRWYLPGFPSDLTSAALIAILMVVWLLPYLRRFTLPGGVGGEFRDTLPAPRGGPPPPPGRPSRIRQEESEYSDRRVRQLLRLRMLTASTPQIRGIYTTLIETAVFVKIETDMAEPGDEVQRYPRIVVDGAPTWCSFHAAMRPKRRRAREFFFIVDAVGGTSPESIEAVMRELRTRAEYADQVLPPPLSEYVLVLVSDFEEREPNDRSALSALVDETGRRVGLRSVRLMLLDFNELPF